MKKYKGKYRSKFEGLKHFYRQMLIGDPSDNIKGVTGVGKVKASKLIDSLDSEVDMQKVVCDLYNDGDRYQMNADCLWILRHEEQQWSDR